MTSHIVMAMPVKGRFLMDRRKSVSHDDEPILGRAIPEVASTIHVAIERLYRILRDEFDDFLKSTGGLKLAEWRVLTVLNTGGAMAQKDIVTAVLMEQAQVSRALWSMHKSGLIAVERGASDRRVWLFSLSAKGQQLCVRMHPLAIERRRRLDGLLEEADRAKLFGYLRVIAKACRKPD